MLMFVFMCFFLALFLSFFSLVVVVNNTVFAVSLNKTILISIFNTANYQYLKKLNLPVDSLRVLLFGPDLDMWRPMCRFSSGAVEALPALEHQNNNR